jgi:hypothetical protein
LRKNLTSTSRSNGGIGNCHHALRHYVQASAVPEPPNTAANVGNQTTFDIDDTAFMMYCNRPIQVQITRVGYHKRRARNGKRPGGSLDELITCTTYDVEGKTVEHLNTPVEALFPTKEALLASL